MIVYRSYGYSPTATGISVATNLAMVGTTVSLLSMTTDLLNGRPLIWHLIGVVLGGIASVILWKYEAKISQADLLEKIRTDIEFTEGYLKKYPEERGWVMQQSQVYREYIEKRDRIPISRHTNGESI